MSIAGDWRWARRFSWASCCWSPLCSWRAGCTTRPRSARIDGPLSGLLLELFGGIITLRTAGAESRAFCALGGAIRRAARAPDPRAAVLASGPPVAGYLPDPHGDGRVYRGDSYRPGPDGGGELPRLQHRLRQPGGGDPGEVGYTSIGAARHAAGMQRILPILQEEPGVPRGRDRTGAAGGCPRPEPRFVPLSRSGAGERTSTT